MEEPPLVTILVAEDDPVMAKLLEFNLMREEFQVIICRSGDQVIPRMKEVRPALVLLDYIMPGMTGQHILDQLKEEADLRTTPVIVVTGQGRESIKTQLLGSGAKAVFTKPFSTIALIKAIHAHLPKPAVE